MVVLRENETSRDKKQELVNQSNVLWHPQILE